jgi:SpoVK/Ycf46/Vps4 family AAA+-type ATPase
VFSGPAGTGKTTAAREIARLYHALGVAEKDTFVELGPGDLQGEYMGQTPKLVQQKFDEARGGVIFIDEAYDLVAGKQDMYGQQAVTTMLKLVEDRRDDTVVILAGYPDKLEGFFATNEGLRSRFPTTIDFPAFTQGQLLQILGQELRDKDFTVARGASGPLRQAMAGAGGNAREVREMAAKIMDAHALRVETVAAGGQDAPDLTRITTEDVRAGLADYARARPRKA